MSKRIHRLVLAAAIGAVTAVVVAVSVVVVARPARAAASICNNNGSAQAVSVAGGRYVVMNNNWGDATTQCIDATDTGFAVTSVAHNNPTNGPPGSYPAIYTGCHWGTCSDASSGLPMQASDGRFAAVRASVTMSYPGGGTYDAAYDIWFNRGQPTPSTGQNDGAEMMVWLNHTGAIQPVGSWQATVSLAGTQWDVWFGAIGSAPSWNVISYVRTVATTTQAFAVADFYADVVARGYGQTSWWLSSVQAGFEPWVGGTGLAVTAFSYDPGTPTPTPTPSSPPPSPSPGRGGSIVGAESGRCVDIGGNATNGDPIQLGDCHGRWDQQWVVSGTSIKNPQSGRCLAVVNNDTGNGAGIQLWDCIDNGGQNWQVRPDGTIVNIASGRCLDAGGSGDGAPLQIWSCGHQANQRWTITPTTAG